MILQDVHWKEKKMMEQKEEKFDLAAYRNKYISENYDRICFVVPKGKKVAIKEAAKAAGQSMNAYILESVEKRMNGKEME